MRLDQNLSETIFGRGYIGNKGTFDGGPFGFGDPSDKTLNEMEMKVVIPMWEKNIIRREYCANENQAYEKCHLDTNILNRFYKCSNCKSNINNCIKYWQKRTDIDLRERAIANYLEERSLFRTTGMSREERQRIANSHETIADRIVNKIRSFVLNEDEMKQYQKKLEEFSKEI